MVSGVRGMRVSLRSVLKCHRAVHRGTWIVEVESGLFASLAVQSPTFVAKGLWAQPETIVVEKIVKEGLCCGIHVNVVLFEGLKSIVRGVVIKMFLDSKK